MHIRIGLELDFEGKVIAWALDYPGCFCYGEDEQEALLLFPRAFIAYQSWVNFKAGDSSWVKDITDFDVRLEESFQNFQVDEQYRRVEDGAYTVNAWFRNDWRALTTEDVKQALLLLDWSRRDLLGVIAPLDDTQREKKYPGERWNIEGILKHIGSAEWWYLDSLDQAGIFREALPPDPIERLTQVREHFKTVLPEWTGREMVRGRSGELWSPRKVIRRAIWHEKDHIVHIYKLLAEE
jgi:hypothetical protein